ncbi:MAG: four helix bundle protein [Bacteroidales bacterium]|jgi:four helix bundle protein|nr:four helix bundle protein [Bacteroidales bacterium]
MKIERFEDLEIWQQARVIARQVFEISQNLPFSKDNKFKDQIRDSSGSIMDNIAEGFGRSGNKEFVQFLSIAKGSNDETRSQVYRAFDYQYIDEATKNELVEKSVQLSKKISSFIQYLKKSTYRGPKFPIQ